LIPWWFENGYSVGSINNYFEFFPSSERVSVSFLFTVDDEPDELNDEASLSEDVWSMVAIEKSRPILEAQRNATEKIQSFGMEWGPCIKASF